mmetsp:Transcript_18353/g.64457  ORF Transcript_18353/g.64457 Transcript_18353/m.64457 type:complete len:400 (+) Transcript_18353:1267-2466(+)
MDFGLWHVRRRLQVEGGVADLVRPGIQPAVLCPLRLLPGFPYAADSFGNDLAVEDLQNPVQGLGAASRCPNGLCAIAPRGFFRQHRGGHPHEFGEASAGCAGCDLLPGVAAPAAIEGGGSIYAQGRHVHRDDSPRCFADHRRVAVFVPRAAVLAAISGHARPATSVELRQVLRVSGGRYSVISVVRQLPTYCGCLHRCHRVCRHLGHFHRLGARPAGAAALAQWAGLRAPLGLEDGELPRLLPEGGCPCTSRSALPAESISALLHFGPRGSLDVGPFVDAHHDNFAERCGSRGPCLDHFFRRDFPPEHVGDFEDRARAGCECQWFPGVALGSFKIACWGAMAARRRQARCPLRTRLVVGEADVCGCERALLTQDRCWTVQALDCDAPAALLLVIVLHGI